MTHTAASVRRVKYFLAWSFLAPFSRLSVSSKGRAMATLDFDDSLVERLFPAPIFASTYTSSSAPTPNAGITPDSTAALRRLLTIRGSMRFAITKNSIIIYRITCSQPTESEPQDMSSKVPSMYKRNTNANHTSLQGPSPTRTGPSIQTMRTSTMNTRASSRRKSKHMDYPRLLKNLCLAAGKVDQRRASHVGPIYVCGNSPSDTPWARCRVWSGRNGRGSLHDPGLAQTAVHDVDHENLYDANYFNPPSSAGSHLPSLDSAPSLITPNTKPQHTHAFTILARILEDDRPEAGKTCTKDSTAKFIDTLNSAGVSFRSIHPSGKSARMEKRYKSDWKIWPGWRFDVVHLFTSNLFVPSIFIPPQACIQRRPFACVLSGPPWVLFVCHGRPALDIKGFFSVTADPKPDQSSSLTDLSERVGDPWYTLLAEIIPHRDEHHIKTERTLAHCAALYGTRPKGHLSHTGLKGSREIDGTLFVRTGGLLMDVLQWTSSPGCMGDQDYGEQALWSKSGLGWD
ncbi:hypothetical protein RHS01_10716 [Rhizoctonia solani]|uniref:Uncharacterized protein n=1 Tax=Rhizoctonia solani TaxID=456999 RepID=A0A8H7I2W7_9AGAM|nr:hypothetical protein RHS01_10716 [Rhizoctonia solani]